MTLPDGEYVHRDDLMRVLRPFRIDGTTSHEQKANAGRIGGAQGRGGGRWDYATSREEVDTSYSAPETGQRALSRATGLSSQMVSRYVNGKAGEWVALERADLLLTRAGLHHHFLTDVPIHTFVKGINITATEESATMAAEQSTGNSKYWCSGCQHVRTESEVVFYVDLGRMDLVCRSGKILPLERAEQLGLVPPSG